MPKQERSMRQMDRDLLGAVVVVNNEILGGNREDTAGPLAAELLRSHRVHVSGQREVSGQRDAVPKGSWDRLHHCAESLDAISSALDAAIAAGSRVIVTVGGTGISAGDVTPEATAPFLEVRMDGIAQQVREHGLSVTPLASLSRGLVGITHRGPGGVLIVNAPGSRGGVKDSLSVVCPLLPHIFEQLDDEMD